METTLQYTFFSILFFFIAFRILSIARSRRGPNLPPSPLAIPVIGHLHLLKSPVHRTLHRINQKLGPVFSLRFGSQLVVVVSSSSVAEECFTKNDVVLANRPQLFNGKYLAYDNSTVATALYGDHWRNLRRLMAMEIFSTTRLNNFTTLRQEEIEILIHDLSQSSSRDFARVELKSKFYGVTFNIIMRMIAGKRYYGEGLENSEGAMEFREMVSDVFKNAGSSNHGDFLPFLRWIDYKGYEKNLKKINKKMDALLQGLVDEHRLDKSGNSMIDHLLSLQELQPEYYSDTIIKGLILVMIIAGTDTTAVTMEWAMSNLLNHPEMLKKAQAELDTHVGKERIVDENDLPGLKYLQAIISETLRLFPAGPLSVPHMSSDHCTIFGYDVPRNTMLLVNIWAIHRDPNIWDDPTTFKPERFEDDDVEGNRLITFGLGRRACPGVGLTQRVMGVTLGSLIQCFDWKRVSEEAVDLTEGEGLTMPKIIPLEAMCKDRNIMNKIIPDASNI